MLIGVGEQENGLYFFRGMAMAAATQSSGSLSSDVWHGRLGHPSSKALKMLQFSDFNTSTFDFKKCEICIRAKQTRDSFPLSINKTSFAFELVHCDLWVHTELLLYVGLDTFSLFLMSFHGQCGFIFCLQNVKHLHISETSLLLFKDNFQHK